MQQGYKDMYCQNNSSPFYNLRGDDDQGGRNGSRFTADIGELEHVAAAGNLYHIYNPGAAAVANLTGTTTTTTATGSSYNKMKTSNVSINVSSNAMHFGELNNARNSSMGCGEIPSGRRQQLMVAQHGGGPVVSGGGNVHLAERWRDSSSMVMQPQQQGDHSQTTDTATTTTSTYTTDDINQNQFPGAHGERLVDVDSADRSKERNDDQKALRRLAQNREAARKSRMRKKAYVHQLESSRAKLAELEQEVKKARQQGMYVASHQNHTMGGNGPSAFDIEYAQWLDEHQRLINDLRAALNSNLSDNELSLLVEEVMSHYDEIFRLKCTGAKTDVFHMLFGMWKTPVERCFLWLGGFRCSEVLKVLGNQVVPLTEQQLVGICNLQQLCQQAEDALSQGMEALQQGFVETLSSNSLAPHNSGNVADYMGQMAIAMGKLATLENFLYQADLLRQQTLQRIHQILTTRQTARALLAIHEYTARLRALSSLWLARPKE